MGTDLAVDEVSNDEDDQKGTCMGVSYYCLRLCIRVTC